MKYYKISEILYAVVAIISLFKAIQLWSLDRDKATLFFGFCLVSVLMYFFRRKYRKKFNDRNPKKQ